jgi:hypothetical protein
MEADPHESIDPRSVGEPAECWDDMDQVVLDEEFGVFDDPEPFAWMVTLDLEARRNHPTVAISALIDQWRDHVVRARSQMQ